MKKIISIFIALIVAVSSILPVYAANGKVIYDGNAKDFIFEPASEYSLTDLFPNFKDVMPGDTINQKITVKNDADKKIKVKIYIRSLGAQKESEEFLSQLNLKVKKSSDNKMAYMFDAAADETAQLTDWVYLGTLYSGGKVNLDVSLNVPTELDNEFKNKIGYLDWEFKIEEFPKEPSDPDAPKTGDDSPVELYFILMLSSLLIFIILLIWRKKDKEKETRTAQF